MSAPLYRPSRPEDLPQLLQVWAAAYDGDTACAECYLNRLYQPGDALVAEVDGRLTSAIYLLDGYRFHYAPERMKCCTYLYALGTPPEYRGRGYGGRTIWHAGVEAYNRGAELVCFLPASPSLYRWYTGCIGTSTVFYRREFTVTGAAACGSITPLSPADYAARRESLLHGTPHTELPTSVIELQGTYCRMYGGGLISVEVEGLEGIAAYDREGESLTLRELLFPAEDPTPAVRALLAATSAAVARVRTPAFLHPGLGEIVDDNVLVPGGYTFPKTEQPPYWGLSMD